MTRDDVAIVGGGPAGTVAALVLARRGWRVRIFERARFPRAKLCGDTLNPGALARLDALLDLSPLRARGLPLDGMRLSGPGGVAVEGRYPHGVAGLSVTRAVLDQWLLDHAVAAGAVVEEGTAIRAADGHGGVVDGVRVVATARDRRHPARLVIAADGRASALARAGGLAVTPAAPRRWAFGAYATGVTGMDAALGEMHVRAGRYLGLAPVPGGTANVCLVVGRHDAATVAADPWRAIVGMAAADPVLAGRLVAAHPIGRPVSLGPMAVDVRAAGVPGLLLAGDAAGFIDPMTGDGLRLAIHGAVLAAEIADAVLAGTLAVADAPGRLGAARRRAFATKWRFNRGLRGLVDVPAAVGVAALAARTWPPAFTRLVRYAGDAPAA